MYKYVDSRDISNAISMARTHFEGTVLVVEGITDYRLYGKFSDKKECMIMVAHSKNNALASVRESYHDRKDDRVVGIVDSDLDGLTGTKRKPPVFETDTRDLEMMLIRSKSFDEVLQEYSDGQKMQAFEKKHGTVRDAVIRASYPVGLLMFVSEVTALDLCFRDLNFEAFVNPFDLSCNIDALIDEVLYASGKPPSEAKKVKRALEKEMCKERDPWLVCRGHDAVEVLLIGLKRNFGSFNCRALESGAMAGALRLAFDICDFKGLELYKNTKEWCKSKNTVLWAE